MGDSIIHQNQTIHPVKQLDYVYLRFKCLFPILIILKTAQDIQLLIYKLPCLQVQLLCHSSY